MVYTMSYNEDWTLPFCSLELLYAGIATEGSALMLADRQLKMHFLVGNWVGKFEI